MKKLKDILYRVSIDAVRGTTDLEVADVVFDSRKVVPDSVFIAQKGTVSDGHQFIGKAISSGARAIVYEDDPQEFVERSEEHTSELQSRPHLVCRLLLEKKNYISLHSLIPTPITIQT